MLLTCHPPSWVLIGIPSFAGRPLDFCPKPFWRPKKKEKPFFFFLSSLQGKEEEEEEEEGRMHGRHRSPGDRSTPAGVGTAHSGYRGFGRGGGYRRSGQPKPSSYSTSTPPPPPPPRRRADVLLEAGRLAAEYLVAKGLLPAGLLPPPTAGRSLVKEDGVAGAGGRASALSRLGRRRFDDEDVGFEGRNHQGRGGKQRRRNGSYTRRGSEWGRENGRGGTWPDATWADRGRGYSDAMDGEDLYRPRRWNGRGKGFLDTAEEEHWDRRGGFEGDAGHGGGSINGGEGSFASTMDELMPSKSEVAGESVSEPESDGFAQDNGSKTMEDSEIKRNRASEAEKNLNSKSDDVRASDSEMEEAGEVKDDVDSGASGEAQMKNEVQEEVGELAAHSCPATEDKQPTNRGVSLLSLCGFAKVPTKPRSMAASRSPKTDQAQNAERAKGANDDTSAEGVSAAKTEEVSAVNPSSDTLADRPQGSRGLTSEISSQSTSSGSLSEQPQSSRGPVPEVSGSQSSPLGEESVEHDVMSSIESRCTTSNSFPDSSAFVHQQQEISQARIDEDFADHVKREGTKRQPEWSPSFQSQMDLCFRNLRAKPSDLPTEQLLPDHEMADAVEDEELRDADAFPKVVVDSHNKLEKQRQLASSSFKICDLNLMEAPEVADIPNDPVLEHVPTTSVPLISANNLSVEFGMSIGQRCNDTDGYGPCSSVDKAIPVIDVEDDSPVQVMHCDTSKTGTESVYPNLENFLNHPENHVDLPDIQDGYSLAISEFLGNDIAGCAAVQGDISNLQGGMPFHGAEGIAGVDDPLYVALGELPIGFMDVWDQPPPEYGKFF